jgi:hypothetical protein
MERKAWTDERLDREMSAIDTKFERVIGETRAGRTELRAEIRAVRAEMHAGGAELRAEMQAGFAGLRAELIGLHRQLNLILATFVAGLLGVFGALQL